MATEWRPLDLSGLQARLAEVKALLEQAAALGAAQDADRIRALVETENTRLRSERGHPRRRYR